MSNHYQTSPIHPCHQLGKELREFFINIFPHKLSINCYTKVQFSWKLQQAVSWELSNSAAMLTLMSLVSTLLGLTVAGPVLRYKMDSCNSLEPVYVTESWAYPGGGELDPWLDIGDSEGGKGLFDSPRRSSDRSPPFSIHIEFDQYRRNREYTGLESNSYSVVTTNLLFSPHRNLRVLWFFPPPSPRSGPGWWQCDLGWGICPSPPDLQISRLPQ